MQKQRKNRFNREDDTALPSVYLCRKNRFNREDDTALPSVYLCRKNRFNREDDTALLSHLSMSMERRLITLMGGEN
jgi:hypothetical protein